MAYKMKKFSGFGNSPLKQDKKKFKGINWDTLDNVTVDGKTPKEIKKENLQKERDKWNEDLIKLRERDYSTKKKPVPKPKGGFMHPPYKKPVGPTEKHHYVHGYKKTK